MAQTAPIIIDRNARLIYTGVRFSALGDKFLGLAIARLGIPVQQRSLLR